MPAIPRQRRYDQVMGDREPKVTDKRFVQELQQRLEDKYLTTQCQKEKKLAEAESRRVRKLVLDGVIDVDDHRRSQADSGKDQDWKEFWPQNPHKTLAEYQEEKKRKAEESSSRNHQQEEEPETGRQETQQTEPPAASEPSSGAGGGAVKPAGAAAAAAAPVGRYDASRSPRIDEMMSEEDLDQLYRRASEIVYVMAPPAKAAKAKAK